MPLLDIAPMKPAYGALFLLLILSFGAVYAFSDLSGDGFGLSDRLFELVFGILAIGVVVLFSFMVFMFFDAIKDLLRTAVKK